MELAVEVSVDWWGGLCGCCVGVGGGGGERVMLWRITGFVMCFAWHPLRVLAWRSHAFSLSSPTCSLSWAWSMAPLHDKLTLCLDFLFNTQSVMGMVKDVCSRIGGITNAASARSENYERAAAYTAANGFTR